MRGQEEPSFGRLREVLYNRREPGRVPFFEVGVDPYVLEAFVGTEPEPQTQRGEHERLLGFYHELGYDYVPMGVTWYTEEAYRARRTAPGVPDRSCGWAPMDGPVASRGDYERFPWSDPDSPQTERIKALAELLPDGMKVLAITASVHQPLTERVMGVKNLARALHREPDLVEDVCARLGEVAVSASRAAAELPEVGAVVNCDDLGYQGGTLLSPEHLRKLVFPWHRRLVEAVHAAGKPVVLHSCGNLRKVMEDIIACGYDAKHSFKDTHTPVTEAKALWGDRIALLGGIDMDFLSRRRPEEVRTYVRRILDVCGARGYALGTGNSVADYIPRENYLAMLEEGRVG